MRTQATEAMMNRSSDAFEAWLQGLPDGRLLAEVGVQLRAAAGGSGTGSYGPDDVAGYFRPGRRTEAELIRLWEDAELRRSVASVGRTLAASESVRAKNLLGERLGRRWLGLGVLLAASLAGLLMLPTLRDNDASDAEHRSGAMPTAEVQIVAPTGLLASSPRIEWRPVLGAEVYEVELTDDRGRTVFSERTAATALEIPTQLLDPGLSYFFRVRAQVDVARWISSDFQEIVIPR